MGTAADWSQDTTTPSAPPLGGRQRWLDYTAETTGYGSFERGGDLVHRVTIVHPDDDAALRWHHALVQSGRLRSLVPARRRVLEIRTHVLDRAELVRSRADAPGSWLAAAQDVARLCGTDDAVADVAGPALRRLLWDARSHLGSAQAVAALADLQAAAGDLVTERRRFVLAQRSLRDVEAVRLEAAVYAEVRREWEIVHASRAV